MIKDIKKKGLKKHHVTNAFQSQNSIEPNGRISGLFQNPANWHLAALVCREHVVNEDDGGGMGDRCIEIPALNFLGLFQRLPGRIKKHLESAVWQLLNMLFEDG